MPKKKRKQNPAFGFSTLILQKVLQEKSYRLDPHNTELLLTYLQKTHFFEKTIIPKAVVLYEKDKMKDLHVSQEFIMRKI